MEIIIITMMENNYQNRKTAMNNYPNRGKVTEQHQGMTKTEKRLSRGHKNRKITDRKEM